MESQDENEKVNRIGRPKPVAVDDCTNPQRHADPIEFLLNFQRKDNENSALFIIQGSDMANYLQVEQEIVLSFKRLMSDHNFDEISIAEIAAGARITRRSFYNHYKDKYDLVNKIFDQDVFPFVLNVTNINDWYKGSLYICNYLKKNQLYYKRILPLQGQNCLQEGFHKLTEMQMELLIPEALQGRGISREDKLFLTEYYYHAYMGLVRKWVMGVYNFSSEEFVMRWRSLMENSLHNFLRDFAH